MNNPHRTANLTILARGGERAVLTVDVEVDYVADVLRQFAQHQCDLILDDRYVMGKARDAVGYMRQHGYAQVSL